MVITPAVDRVSHSPPAPNMSTCSFSDSALAFLFPYQGEREGTWEREMDGRGNIKIFQTDTNQFKASRNLPDTNTMDAINSGREIETCKTARIETFVEQWLNVLPK